MTKPGAKEARLRELREGRNGPRVGTVSRSTIDETGTLLAGPNLDREEQKQQEKAVTTKTAKKTKKPAAKAKPATKRKVPGVDRSPLAVGTFIAREGGASMAELEKHFKMKAHPMRAKIHDARHKLSFAITYDSEKGRYFGQAPKAKAAA